MPRKNRYRKSFYEASEILGLYKRVKEKFELLTHLHGKNEITDIELISLGLLTLYQDFHKGCFIGSQRKYWPSLNLSFVKIEHFPILELNSKIINLHPVEVFQKFNIKSCPQRINETILNWSAHKWQLKVVFEDPSPEEMLDLQIKGKRVIGFPGGPQDFCIKEGRDPLSFLLHDLFHAEKFFRFPEIYEGQIDFFRELKERIIDNQFKELLKFPQFCKDFHYLISDMNTHPEHQRSYLQAILFKHSKAQLEKSTVTI